MRGRFCFGSEDASIKRGINVQSGLFDGLIDGISDRIFDGIFDCINVHLTRYDRCDKLDLSSEMSRLEKKWA